MLEPFVVVDDTEIKIVRAVKKYLKVHAPQH